MRLPCSLMKMDGRKGSNVVAVKAAPLPNADILVLSAHHDSVPTAYGANDNASGVAALLYVAELLQDIPTDTEVRFISFTDEENGKCGSRFYTSSLAQAEKERMVGNIQFDMLGGLGTEDALVCTMDGEANWVSDLLQQQDSALRRGRETASDHASLQLAGVPSVLLMQNGRGYLYHSAADTAEQLNPYAIARNGRARGGCGKGNPFCRYAVLPGTGAGTGTELYLSSDTAKCDLLWKFPLRY